MTSETASSNSAQFTSIHHALLAWYAEHGRDLPWRHTSDPYHILVAEIMLQQTQVERVIPKYREFLDVYPTIKMLAQAPRAEIIRRWSPLGYNRRAVRLHEIAQQVVEQHGGRHACPVGRFPNTVAEMLTLKGVGAYTAGAIACFAFRQPVAFLDTNIRRVLGRALAGVPYPAPEDDKRIMPLAEGALPTGPAYRTGRQAGLPDATTSQAAYQWHQALMDLGATVCARQRPRCLLCPLQEHCKARSALSDETASVGSRMVAEKPPPYRVQPKFAGSTRFYRGRIVAALRELSQGETLNLAELGSRVKPDFTATEAGWLAGLVRALATDGLVEVMDDAEAAETWRVRLP